MLGNVSGHRQATWFASIDVDLVQKMQNYAKAQGLTQFVSMQNLHNPTYREEEREIEALTLLSQKDGSDWNDDRCHRLKYGDRISKGTEGTEDTNPNDP